MTLVFPRRHIFCRDDPPDAGPVVPMAVRIDYCNDRLFPGVLIEEVHGGFCRHDGCQGINNDVSRIADDDAHIRQIVAANLINPVGDFEKAMNIVKLRLAPQAGVDGVDRRLPGQKFVLVH